MTLEPVIKRRPSEFSARDCAVVVGGAGSAILGRSSASRGRGVTRATGNTLHL